MPWRDGTGPFGEGPLTGRGLGPCGRGMGWRRGFGWGRGFGWRRFRRQFPPIYVENVQLTNEEKRKILKAELEELENEKREIENELKKLK